MPPPTGQQIKNSSSGFHQSAGLRGEDAPGLAAALADSIGQTLTLFSAQAQILPGIPAAVDPVSGSGATAGPGMLMPPPAGGPGAGQLEGLVQGFLTAQGIRGEDAGSLAKAIAGCLAQGVQLFTAQTKVMPGVPITGFVSTAPGMLLPAPLASQLKSIADGLLQQNGLRGEDAPAVAQAMSQAIDLGFMMFASQMMAAPGIPAAPGSTAGPGRLM